MTTLAVPLLSRGRVQGVLFCVGSRQAPELDEQDLAVVSGMAARAASALGE